MTTEVWFTGKHWDGFIREGVAFYEKRLRPLLPIKLDILKDGGTGADALEREGSHLLKKILPGDMIILLDEQGEHFNSRGFASYLDQLRLKSPKRLIFILGGAYGFKDEIKSRSAGLLSLSSLTFNHQLARIVFLEQLYRGMTILNGHPYHHD
ncbi:MAG: 23S rRNA (pseudouridine(1915)-N(3))-methyltransferase RlmH [Saprospiraceae bacterium]|nr:23S rRNA (pseudouridine(1915)-N(3))-methyltransferase RlmH [Saprospiraceae bacterium]